MQKKQLLFVSLLLSTSIFAQKDKCQEKIENLLLNNIKNYPSDQLIPYYSKTNRQWGYFDKKTGKKLTKPVLNDPYFFNPKIEFAYSLEVEGQDGCNGTISGSKNQYELQKVSAPSYELGSVDAPRIEKPNYESYFKESITGFETDKKGKIIHFNPKFFDNTEMQPRILETFKIQGKVYVLVYEKSQSKNTYTIFNEKGEALPNFKNSTSIPRIKQQYDTDTDIWCLVEINKDEYYLKSLLKNETIPVKITNPLAWQKLGRSLGYAAFKTEKGDGVMDLTTMKWKIQPSKKNNFYDLNFASLETLVGAGDYSFNQYSSNVLISKAVIEANRKKASIYVENDDNTFSDLNLKKYIAK